MKKIIFGIEITLIAALILGGVLTGFTAPAVVYADCVRTGNDVDCTGVDNNGYHDTSGSLNVHVEPGAVVNDASSQAIRLGDNNTVVNDGTLNTDHGTPPNNRDGLRVGDGNTITNNDAIMAGGNFSDGISISDNNTVTNNGTIDVNGNSAMGVRVNGNNNTVTNNGTITVETNNAGMYTDPTSTGNTLTNDGTIVVNGDNSAAMQTDDSGNTLTNNGTIVVNGVDSDGMVATDAPVNVTNNGTIITTGANSQGISMESASGADVVTNNGTITSNNAEAIVTGGGNDTVVNNGTVNGDIDTGTGNDTVTLGDGPVNGTVIGGSGYDVLRFGMTVPASQINALAAQIAALSGDTGLHTLTINGNPYTWTEMEELVNMLQAAAQANGGYVVVGFTDGRLNSMDFQATVVLFCTQGNAGLDLYAVTGGGVEFAYRVDSPTIQQALAAAQAAGQPVEVAPGRLGAGLWALDAGTLLASGSGNYTFTFEANVCGLGG